MRKYGREVFRQTCEDLMDYSERRMRAEIAAFPDGRYRFEDVIENDGIEARPYTVAIDVFVQGDEVVADYSRSSPQARGPISATLGVSTGAVYNGMLHITDPSIPKNSGCFRPIRVVSPPGRVTNVDYPGPLVAGNTETHPRLANIVIGAHGGLRAGAGHGLGELHGHQLRVRRQPSRPRRVFRLLRHHVGRLGRPVRRGRERLRDRASTATAASTRPRSSRPASRCMVENCEMIPTSAVPASGAGAWATGGRSR